MNARQRWMPWMLRYYGIRPHDVRSFTTRELERMEGALAPEVREEDRGSLH